jgi:hypothetical protein
MTETQQVKKPHRNQHNNHKQLRIDTTVSAGYTRPHTHGLGIWNNPRVPFTVRVDKKLKNAFTEASKHFSGSTCSAIEYIMAAYIGAYKQAQINGVYPTLTNQPKIEIGEIKIERNLRPRRKLDPEPVDDSAVCCFRGCDNPATTEAYYVPLKEKRKLCDNHVSLLAADNAPSSAWRFY